jgi:hypothetical protein
MTMTMFDITRKMRQNLRKRNLALGYFALTKSLAWR